MLFNGTSMTSSITRASVCLLGALMVFAGGCVCKHAGPTPRMGAEASSAPSVVTSDSDKILAARTGKNASDLIGVPEFAMVEAPPIAPGETRIIRIDFNGPIPPGVKIAGWIKGEPDWYKPDSALVGWPASVFTPMDLPIKAQTSRSVFVEVQAVAGTQAPKSLILYFENIAESGPNKGGAACVLRIEKPSLPPKVVEKVGDAAGDKATPIDDK